VLQCVAVSDSSDDDLEHNLHGTQMIPFQFLYFLTCFIPSGMCAHNKLHVRTQRCVTVSNSSNDDSEHDSYGSKIVPCNVFILFHVFMSNISKNKLDCDWVIWARVMSHVFNILTCTNIAFDACF